LAVVLRDFLSCLNTIHFAHCVRSVAATRPPRRRESIFIHLDFCHWNLFRIYGLGFQISKCSVLFFAPLVFYKTIQNHSIAYDCGVAGSLSLSFIFLHELVGRTRSASFTNLALYAGFENRNVTDRPSRSQSSFLVPPQVILVFPVFWE